MNINQYAVYQLKESAELAAYRSRSYQYLTEHYFQVIVQNYQQAYFTKLFTSDTPEMIRKRLEEHRPKNFRGRPFGVGDVIVINQQGEITAYFVDKDSLVVVAGFIRSSSSGILVTLDTKNLFIDGCAGTWMATEECVVESQHFFLMQHEVYKEKAPNVIVDASGKLVSTEIRKGLDEDARKKILDYLNKNRKATTKELSQLLDVSTTTIRTDLNQMDRENLITKTHGGAVYNDRSLDNIELTGRAYFFDERALENQKEKEAIANKESYDKYDGYYEDYTGVSKDAVIHFRSKEYDIKEVKINNEYYSGPAVKIDNKLYISTNNKVYDAEYTYIGTGCYPYCVTIGIDDFCKANKLEYKESADTIEFYSIK